MRVTQNPVPSDTNVPSSHVLYKVKVNDDGSLSLKARMAPNGNEDIFESKREPDCCMCLSIGIRQFFSIAATRKWQVVIFDVDSAFMQSVRAQRDVYIIPSRESSHRNEFRLLLAATYGLVNSNAKRPVESNSALYAFGLKKLSEASQLFDGVIAGT